MARRNPDWKPEFLKQYRESHALTLEETGEQLREIAQRHSFNIAANFQTIWGHESGSIYPGPHYRRAYCLLYDRNEAELGFRRALPGEETRVESVPDPQNKSLPDPSNAIVEALGVIQPGSDDVDSAALRDRVLDAWRRRAAGGVADTPSVLLVGGYAGSGKSEFAKFLGSLTGWPILDKDSITRPLVDQFLIALGGEANDRSSELYREKVRPLEYRCLLEAAWDNLNCGISTILDAPFVSEFSQADWMQRFHNRCRSKRVTVATIWVRCDPESMREYIEFRGAPRDAWKMESWEEYLSGLDMEMKPQGPHFVVDNRLGGAVAMADQARDALSGGGL
ncbi:ATP-binding protein [Streptomyces sp. Je 1-4]|uniref:AAA family ATPase n=1 Tax=Streptomyces TaxID=1883 RepID=UPI0021D85181|nr:MULTISPECIES: ATP-binding protein [unclassified Streptomyces]UYB41708.1 ATP-binding protein [Streptomyces sp. Je 1-4]UZQ37967.1 ATP-binding protein [Streptomyces sp. Je 1-4] [Streptomyces sp. Je 1-4 4N24]UZQ45384.1 ATP-binding protein [Streptomyces sp. Je 1-4] [Streptomyces sp. Je 1-4 4N24_ara]